MRKIVASLLLFLPLALGAQPGAAYFTPDYAIGDIRVDYGRYASVSYEEYEAPYLRVIYSRLFWNRFAYRAGAQLSFGMPGHSFQAGIPVGVSYRPWIQSLGYRLVGAATQTVTDVVVHGMTGQTEQLLSNAATNFLVSLFRHSEYFIGITPGMYFGGGAPDFSCTADVGFVIGLPIWRVGLNVSPTYHYSLTKNYFLDGEPCRSFFSLTAGLSYMF